MGGLRQAGIFVLQLASVLYPPGAVIFMAAAIALSHAEMKSQQRNQRNRARDAHNASLRDRMQMVDIQADAPRTMALGRVRAVEGVRRRWASGTHSEKLTLVVSFAGHEIDGFEQFFFDDAPITIGGDGWVTSFPYLRTARAARTALGTLDGLGEASIDLGETPIGGTVTAVWQSGSGDNQTQGTCTVVMSGTVAQVSGGPSGASVGVGYEVTLSSKSARVRTYLGTATQSVGGDLAGEYAGAITADDHFRGIALAVVDLIYDQDVFPNGLPQITATFRGAKVLDPRTGLTAWSENPALLAYHYARNANGWAVPQGQIRTADVIEAADVCDVPVAYQLQRPGAGAPDTVILPRFVCGITLPTDTDPRRGMESIVEAMAGRIGWAGGTLRMRAGYKRTPVFTVTEGWLAHKLDALGNTRAGPVARITNATTRATRINRVSGRCVDSDQRYQVLPFPAVSDPVLIAQHGELAVDVEFPGVRHIAHAQQLGKIMVRESQASLRTELTCNLSAFAVELFDVGHVRLLRYGMTGHTHEVIGWRWHPSDGVTLRLAETAPEIYSTDTLTGRDPAPNTILPSPWDVPQLTGLAVSSGLVALSDKTVVTRTRVTWTQSARQGVLVGGHVEIQFMRVNDPTPAGEWPNWTEPGSSAEAVIDALLAGHHYLFRARFVQGFPPVRGPWSAAVMHAVAAVRAPTVFKQTTQPANPIEGDQWFDTDDGNLLRAYLGGVWQVVPVGTGAISPGAVTTGSITDTSTTVGSTGAPGSSVRVVALWGPDITTEAGDELDFVVSGVLDETFWSQPAIASVELWLTRADSFGMPQTEFGTRRKFQSAVNNFAATSYFPLDMTGQLAPGATTQSYVLRVSITYRDAAGAAVQCAKDFSAVAQWRVVKRKR